MRDIILGPISSLSWKPNITLPWSGWKSLMCDPFCETTRHPLRKSALMTSFALVLRHWLKP